MPGSKMIDGDVVARELARGARHEGGEAGAGAGGQIEPQYRHLHRQRSDVHDAAELLRCIAGTTRWMSSIGVTMF